MLQPHFHVFTSLNVLTNSFVLSVCLLCFNVPSNLSLFSPSFHLSPGLTGRTLMTSRDPESAATWASSPSTSRLISFRTLPLKMTWWAVVVHSLFSRSPEEIDLSLCSVIIVRTLSLDSSSASCRVCSLVVPQLVLHLQPIFDWNVKQLFLYLSAEYATKSNVSHTQHTHKHTRMLDAHTGKWSGLEEQVRLVCLCSVIHSMNANDRLILWWQSATSVGKQL